MFKKRLIFSSLWIIAFAGILYFIFFSQFFRIRKVVINSPEIEKLVEKCKGRNILTFSLSKEAKEIEKNPRIKEVKARKVLPYRVEWEINFREPVLCLRRGRMWFGVDEKGIIFSVKKPKIYPILIWDKKIEEGETSPELRSASLIYMEMRKVLPGLKILSIEAGERETVLRLKRGIKVIFSQEGVSTQVQNLKKILKSVNPKSYIDLRFGNNVIVK